MEGGTGRIAPRGTGRIKDPPDERDFLLRAAPLRAALPPGYSRTAIGPILDQGMTSQCVAYTSSTIKMHQEFRQHRRYYDFNEPELYARCKEIDGFPGEQGTTNRAALSIMRNRGMQAKRTEALPTHLFKIGDYVRLSTLDEIKQAVYGLGLVILGIEIDSRWYTEADDGQLGEPNDDMQGGHDIAVIGWNDGRRKSLKIKNSWGRDWGYNGIGWLPYSHLEHYSDWDAWSVTDAEGWWAKRRKG
jgi:C1A family cysteine protease